MKTWMAIGMLLSGIAAAAQEATVVLPHAYRVQFENAWVRVTRVSYGPREKLPTHTHTPVASAYVYLNDGPPVRYTHVDGHTTVATRPPTKARAFRVFRGIDETHEAENLGDVPSEFLRVEFKTEAHSQETFTGRFTPPAGAVRATASRVEFEHPITRITRLTLAAGETLGFEDGNGQPSLLIALAPARLALGTTRHAAALALDTGAAHWIDEAGRHDVRNTGHAATELLRFEFRTPPQRPDGKAGSRD